MTTPTEPNELLNVPADRWHVRTTVTKGYNRRTDMNKDTITVELIYGQIVPTKGNDDVTRDLITGEVYHVLSGPTAQASIEDMARKLNADGFVPKRKAVKTRADGYRQGRNAPNTLHKEFELPMEYQS